LGKHWANTYAKTTVQSSCWVWATKLSGNAGYRLKSRWVMAIKLSGNAGYRPKSCWAWHDSMLEKAKAWQADSMSPG
jgi:lipoate-protein ligase A